MSYRVYVIQNHEERFYIGLSDDVVRRVEQHNTGQSRWTRGRGPWEIAWQSEELSLTDARKLENRLKRQGRGKGFYAITGLHRSERSCCGGRRFWRSFLCEETLATADRAGQHFTLRNCGERKSSVAQW